MSTERTFTRIQIPYEDLLTKVVPVGKIRYKTESKHVEDLAMSMAEHGQRQPVVVYKHVDPETHEETWKLTSGEHRFEAAKRNPKKAPLDAYETEPMSDLEVVVDALTENVQKEMSPVDMLYAVVRVKEALVDKNQKPTDANVSDVLRAAGYRFSSTSEISKLRKIGMTCTEKTKDLLHTGAISLGFLNSLMRKEYALTSDQIEHFCVQVSEGLRGHGSIIKDLKAKKEAEEKEAEEARTPKADKEPKPKTSQPSKSKTDDDDNDDDDDDVAVDITGSGGFSLDNDDDNNDSSDDDDESKPVTGAGLSFLLFHRFPDSGVSEEAQNRVLDIRDYLCGESCTGMVPITDKEKAFLLDTLTGHRTFDELVEFIKSTSAIEGFFDKPEDTTDTDQPT